MLAAIVSLFYWIFNRAGGRASPSPFRGEAEGLGELGDERSFLDEHHAIGAGHIVEVGQEGAVLVGRHSGPHGGDGFFDHRRIVSLGIEAQGFFHHRIHILVECLGQPLFEFFGDGVEFGRGDVFVGLMGEGEVDQREVVYGGPAGDARAEDVPEALRFRGRGVDLPDPREHRDEIALLVEKLVIDHRDGDEVVEDGAAHVFAADDPHVGNGLVDPRLGIVLDVGFQGRFDGSERGLGGGLFLPGPEAVGNEIELGVV